MQNNIFEKNQIYNRQLAVLILCTAIVSKVTRLPRYISINISNMVFLVELLLCIMDILCFFVIYLYISMDGLKLTKEKYPKTLKFLLFILMLGFFIKMFTAYSSTAVYIISTMFRSVPPFIVLISMIVPIVYIAYKGLVSLARTAEVLFWIIFAITIFNLVFYQAEMNLSRLLPIMKDDFSVLSGGFMTLGVYAGDLAPFLLLTLKKRKIPFLAFSIPLNYILVMVFVVLAVATFGDALFIAENIFVYIPIFNEFALTLGELQWLGLIPWFFMMMLHISCMQWAVYDIGEYLFKKRTVFIVVSTIIMLVVLLSVPSLQLTFPLVTRLPVSIFCWIAFTVVPLLLLLLAIFAKHKKSVALAQQPESDDENNTKNAQSLAQQNPQSDSTDSTDAEQKQPQATQQENSKNQQNQMHAKQPLQAKQPQEQTQSVQDKQQKSSPSHDIVNNANANQTQNNQDCESSQESTNVKSGERMHSDTKSQESVNSSQGNVNNENNDKDKSAQKSGAIITPLPARFKNSLLETKQEGENS